LRQRPGMLSLSPTMNDSAPTHSSHHGDGSEAWLRHYAEAAERRRVSVRPRRQPYFQYRAREARWARLIALLAAGLLIAWVYLVK
jgi:hypothetical protein